MRDQRSQARWNKVKVKTRDKVKKKIAWKREQETAPDTTPEVTIEQAMKDLPDLTLLTDKFQERHVSWEAPDAQIAIAVAVRRQRDPSTTLFLEPEDLQVLADEVRDFHSRQYRKRGHWTLFTTDKAYPYVNVTGAPAAPVASAIQWGRIRFGMKHTGDVEFGDQSAPVYAISHIEDMFPTRGEKDDVSDEEAVPDDNTDDDDV